MQRAVLGQAFHRRDLVPGGLAGRRGARRHGPEPQQHRAGAAGALAAAQLGPGNAQLLAEHLEQAAFRAGGHLAGDAIDGDREPRFHHGPYIPGGHGSHVLMRYDTVAKRSRSETLS